MSATVVREKRQVTLPADVFQEAGLKVNDQVEWRFEDGEIRGRRLVHEPEPRRIVGKLVRAGDALILQANGIEVDPEDIARAVREERDSR
jgi:bifunctional DNA-binding transcriptional regulator/antitoxin component of YhaV-PrlF toxin-antitoxin module